MLRILISFILLSFTSVSYAKVSQDHIKNLSMKLKGGEYTGTFEGKDCTVSVIDNGGDGSAYSVRVSPSSGTENFLADFTVTPGQEGEASDMGASSIGVNFIQSLALVRKPDGTLWVRVSNTVGSETATGRCSIPTR